MTSDNDHTASCACGQFSVVVSGAPDIVSACNCLDCQRRTGSVFGVAAYYPREQLISVEGASKAFARGSDAGRNLTMHFCPECGTTVYWDLEMRPSHVGVAVGCFADPEFFAPARAVWTMRRHHWVSFPDGLPTFCKSAE